MPKGKTHDPESAAAIVRRTAELREQRGMTQQEMGDALHITKARYQKWEQRTPIPSPYVVRFCAVAQVDVYYLLTGHHRSKRPVGEAVAAPAEPAMPQGVRLPQLGARESVRQGDGRATPTLRRIKNR